MYSLYKTKKICMFAVAPPSLLYEVPNLNFFFAGICKKLWKTFFFEKGAYFEKIALARERRLL